MKNFKINIFLFAFWNSALFIWKYSASKFTFCIHSAQIEKHIANSVLFVMLVKWNFPSVLQTFCVLDSLSNFLDHLENSLICKLLLEQSQWSVRLKGLFTNIEYITFFSCLNKINIFHKRSTSIKQLWSEIVEKIGCSKSVCIIYIIYVYNSTRSDWLWAPILPIISSQGCFI